jgi:DNA-binding CsgD family transcriptional regulator
MNKFTPSFVKDRIYTTSAIAKEIASPLFKRYGLNFFMCVRFFKDKSTYVVMTNPLWGDVALRNKILLNPPLLPKSFKTLSFFSLWQNAVPHWIEHEMNQCGVYQPISYFHITERFCDFYTFGMDRKNKLGINAYLNELDALKSFCSSFNKEAKKIIQVAEDYKFIPPYPSIPLNETFLKKVMYQAKDSADIFSLKRIASLKFNKKLSKQELNCLEIISYGKTAKECARILELSPKTVENYIYNMKTKLAVHRKSQLIEFYHSIKTFRKPE